MSSPDYGSASYWDERYSADQTNYDWYQDFRILKDYLAPYLNNDEEFEILIPGCGSSKLGSDLYDFGYKNITNIDISTVVINQMSDTYAAKEEMEFSVMDARRLEYVPDQCFDLIIDKALMDAILCADTNLMDIEAYLAEMFRILKSGGTFLIISHAAPDRRLRFLEKSLGSMEIELTKIGKQDLKDVHEDEEGKYHYLYICKKIEE